MQDSYDYPHMSPRRVELLRRYYQESKSILEFGAGGSTSMAFDIGVPEVVSVESDGELCQTLQEKFSQFSTYQILHIDLGPTRDWGYPSETKKIGEWPNYAIRPWSFVREKGINPDTVLIDGRFRLACFLSTLINADCGVYVIFDDFFNRFRQYADALKYVTLVERADSMAVFRKNADVLSPDLAMDFALAVVRPT